MIKIFNFSLALLIIFTLNSCVSCVDDEVEPWKKKSICYTMIQHYVNQQLVIPDAADYDSNITIEPDDIEQSTIVWGNVKAKNNFGVMIPYKYKVKIRYNGGDWSEQSNWFCDFVDISEN